MKQNNGRVYDAARSIVAGLEAWCPDDALSRLVLAECSCYNMYKESLASRMPFGLFMLHDYCWRFIEVFQ
jgi:hypothetical protein